MLTDQLNRPIAGELWWKSDCSARAGSDNPHQPHYQSITRQDQVQIYQELVTAPPTGVAARCGPHAAPTGEMTTSFMSICGRLKDNRLLPTGFLPLDSRIEISRALGAGADMAEDTDPIGVGDDPDYRDGGADTLTYRIPRGDIAGRPASVEATLYLSGNPALLPAGPVLHGDRHRSRPAGVYRERPEAGGHSGGGLEAADGDNRSRRAAQ